MKVQAAAAFFRRLYRRPSAGSKETPYLVSKDTSLRYPDPAARSWDESSRLPIERVLMKNTDVAALAFSAVLSRRKTGSVRVDLHRGPSWDTVIFKPAALKD